MLPVSPDPEVSVGRRYWERNPDSVAFDLRVTEKRLSSVEDLVSLLVEGTVTKAVSCSSFETQGIE
jgi:hypothetical protein